jgi:hypothetical protein
VGTLRDALPPGLWHVQHLLHNLCVAWIHDRAPAGQARRGHRHHQHLRQLRHALRQLLLVGPVQADLRHRLGLYHRLQHIVHHMHLVAEAFPPEREHEAGQARR